MHCPSMCAFISLRVTSSPHPRAQASILKGHPESCVGRKLSEHDSWQPLLGQVDGRKGQLSLWSAICPRSEVCTPQRTLQLGSYLMRRWRARSSRAASGQAKPFLRICRTSAARFFRLVSDLPNPIFTNNVRFSFSNFPRLSLSSVSVVPSACCKCFTSSSRIFSAAVAASKKVPLVWFTDALARVSSKMLDKFNTVPISQ
mmetsp:Transcript_24661/g.41200  ORF Transcript_24661/g.41200 Transcript_24661/m.41200 type:complete len:201 (-) Transcript_24661:377-979(-)